MKRRMIATFSILTVLTGRGFAQSPMQLPPATGTTEPLPIIVPDMKGRAMAISQEPVKAPEGPQSTPVPPVEPPAASAPAPAAASCPCNNDKPIWFDDHTGPPEQIWVRGSYLYWKIVDQPMPFVLAQVDGQPVFGGHGKGVDFGNVNGVRLEAGMWCDCAHLTGFEFNGFLLENSTRNSQYSANGTQGSSAITRPFIDALTEQADVVVVASPAGLQGSLSISNSAQLGSMEFNFTRNLAYTCNYSVNVLAGFRYIDLEEDLTINQLTAQVIPVPANLPFNGMTGFNSLAITDRFHTRNQLFAGQIGARFEARRGIWYSELTAKVALGPNLQKSEITGSTVATGPGVAGTANSGVLALEGANAGNYTTRWFTVAPEVGLRAGVQLSCNVRAFVGYNFLYINNVVRPGDQVNPIINQKFVPTSFAFGTTSGPDQPFVRTSRDDFLAHGVEFGMQFSY